MAPLLGFFVFNFPLGAIFLGDAGAYGLGHILSWLAISLMIRVPEVTPWAVLLIFFWPIADTFFAIYRRRIAGRPTDQPDRLHFHQLVMRALEITLTGRKLRRLTNPMSTVVMMPLFTAPGHCRCAFVGQARLGFGHALCIWLPLRRDLWNRPDTGPKQTPAPGLFPHAGTNAGSGMDHKGRPKA